MILLHGSNRKFNEFKVGKEYSERDMLMEGLGVYMTESEEVASSYGQYIYNISINKKYIFDATNNEALKGLILKLGEIVNIPLEDLIDI